MTTAASLPVQATGAIRARRRGWLERVLMYLVLSVAVVLTGAPFVYMFTGSFKPNAEIFSYPLHFIPQAPTLVNYRRLLGGR